MTSALLRQNIRYYNVIVLKIIKEGIANNMKVKKIKYLKYLEKRKLYFIEKKYQYIDKEICDKYKNANKSNFYELKINMNFMIQRLTIY